MAGFISFSEFGKGTSNPVYTFDDNTVSFTGVITTDGAQPNSPVIAANFSYTGPVLFKFERPVESVSLDVGYFDNLNSTRVVFFDEAGNIVAAKFNSGFGVLGFSAESPYGIVSVAAIDEAFDAAGFSVDSVSFGDAIADAPPLDIKFIPKGNAFVEGFAGSVDDGFGIFFPQSLGGGDRYDDFRISVEVKSIVTLKVVALDGSGAEDVVTAELGPGDHYFRVSAPDGAYDEAVDYRVSYVATPLKDNDKEIQEFIDELWAKLISGGIDLTELVRGVRALLKGSVKSVYDVKKILDGLDKKLGWFGYAFDATDRLDNIVAVAREKGDWKQQATVEIADFVVGFGMSAGVTLGVTTGVSFVGTPLVGGIAGLGAGFVTGIVYDEFLSKKVQKTVGDLYENATDKEMMLAALELRELTAATEKSKKALVVFDEDHYLATYADAAEAVESGAAANAYLHYLTVGIRKGYSPNDTGIVLSKKDIALGPASKNPADGMRTGIFTADPGDYRGDGQSSAELALLNAINDERTDGTELTASKELFAAANRLAIDLVHNREDTPFKALAKGGIDLTKWSNGEAFASGLGIDLAGVTAMVYVSEGATASEALAYFRKTLPNLSALVGLDSEAIGVAEYGGVWVVLIDGDLRFDAEPAAQPAALLRLVGRSASDYLVAGESASFLSGLGGTDVLRGGRFNDSLSGGDDDDLLIGGGGVDKLKGGDGFDQFVFNAETETGVTPGTRDRILDFRKGDIIDVSAIDAQAGGEDNAFQWIGRKQFAEKAGQIGYTKSKKNVVVSGDIDGDGEADFQILLLKVKKLGAGDFLL